MGDMRLEKNLTSHFSILTSHFSLLHSHLSILTSPFSPLNSHLSILTSQFSLLASLCGKIAESMNATIPNITTKTSPCMACKKVASV